jgi:hypothetical protein
MSNSAGIRPNATAPAQAMSSTERNIEAIKRFSKVFLGHGYDRVTKSADKVLELVVEAFSEEDIEVRDYKTFSAIAIDSTHEQAMQAVQNRIQVDVQLPSFNTGVKANFEAKREDRTERNHLVCACVCLDIARSAFSRTPPLRADLKPWDARVGDSVIGSGHSFTGYQISLQVDVERETNKRERNIGGGLASTWFKGLVNLGLDGENIKKALQDRTITKVIITEVIGFGNYMPPIKACLSVANFDDIQKAIDNIRQHFADSLPGIHRRYNIDPKNDLIPFGRLAPQAAPGKIPRELSFDAWEETIRLIEGRAIPYSVGSLDKLAEKIENGVGMGPMKQVLGGLSLVGFLNALDIVFSQTFARKRNLPKADNYCMVIGKTGTGKSTFIGYMLGRDMEMKEISDKGVDKTVLDYKFDVDDGVEYPVIGHGMSMTKGYGVYVGSTQYRRYEAHGPRSRQVTKGYIDTAGYADQSGPETAICNAMAIKMATDSFCPNRIIVMLDSGVFDNRATGFFELFETVKRILKNPESKAAWPFILFLINDHMIKIDPRTRKPIEAAYIINKIKAARNILIEERDALIPQESKGMWGRARDFVSWGMGRNNLDKEELSEEQKKSLHPETLQRIIELQENIDILDGFSMNNIIVADIGDPEKSTRNRVLKWQGHDSRSGLTPNLFSIENLVGNGYPIFRTALTSIATYFNDLYLKEQTQIKIIRNLIIKGHELTNDIQTLQATTAGEEYVELKRECADKLKKEEVKLKNLKDSEKKVIEELTALKLDKVEPYDPIFSTTPIKPRSFFSYVDAWAMTYKFEYKGIPLHSISLDEPTKDLKKSPGGFVTIDDKDISEGRFSAVYRPAWYGYNKDSEAKVSTWIENGNHPAVKQKKIKLEEELGKLGDDRPDEMDTTSIRAQMRDTRRRIAGLKEKVGSYNEAIKEGIKGKEAAKKRIQDIERKLETLPQKRDSLLKEFDVIRAELCVYQGFCQLISQIISELGLNLSGQKTEKHNFQSFVRNFENREKISTYVPPSGTPEEAKTNYFGLKPASGYFEVGNCLFEAISIYSPNSSAAVLREETIKWIGKNEELQDIIKAGIGIEKLQILDAKTEEEAEEDQFVEVTYSSIDDYLQKMRQNKTWGTGIECRALAQLLGQPIYILTKDNQFDQVFEKQLPGEPIFLEYDGSHYRALTCDIGKEKGIAQVILRQINKKK